MNVMQNWTKNHKKAEVTRKSGEFNVLGSKWTSPGL